MDKQWINDEMKKIDVPHNEVRSVIKSGILKAQREKTTKPKMKQFVIPLIASSLIVGFFGSGFVFPQMGRVLADVPIMGKIYSSFHDSVGENLTTSKLVTQLNQQAVSNGLGVTVNGVYYDGGRISVTFKVDHFRPKSNDFWYDVKIADGSYKWDLGAQYGGKVTSDGCVGQILIDYPDKDLPQHMTLPLTFTSFNEVKGKWRFDIPIQQLANKKVNIGESIQSIDNEQKINFETITIGKGSAVLDYKAIYSLSGKDDMARIDKVIDDKGNEIPVLSSGIEFGRKKLITGLNPRNARLLVK